MIIAEIKAMTKDERNVKLYTDLFTKQTDKEFHNFMEYLKAGNILNVVVESDISKNKITFENNEKIAERLGRPFFQYFVTKGLQDLPDTLSNHKYLTMIMPVKRTKHTSAKGVSVSEDSKHVDTITGQPIGVSKAASISGSESSLLYAMGMEKTLHELMVDRADSNNFTLLNNAMSQYGHVPPGLLEKYSGRTQTTIALWVYLRGMHLDLSI